MGDYDVEFVWKESVVYWEGTQGFEFDGAWGNGYLTYLPSAEIWDDVVPEWMRGRFHEVAARITAAPRHRVVFTNEGYSANPEGRCRRRAL